MTSETPGRPLSAKETALSETPARRAMSFIVGRRAGDRLAGIGATPSRPGGEPTAENIQHVQELMRFSDQG
ncbi:hypothetical protein GCM10018782_63640 [Streptomyces griseoaurantiacus]|nr:hypothetical protein GCM10018782_63640 [Streptomyces griseoaurantiacus]